VKINSALPVMLLAVAATAAVAPSPPLQLVLKIPIHHVEGRIDHLSADVTGRRLFVAALENSTVEVLNLRTGDFQSIPDFDDPQGVRFVPELKKLFVASGGDGTCKIVDGVTLQIKRALKLGKDADNVRYDAATKKIYVGYGRGGLAVMDATSGNKTAEIPLDGHPESFQLETAGQRIFVNVPSSRKVAVIDRKKNQVVSNWRLSAEANYPMALDERSNRLFLGCRRPPSLLVLDTATGQLKTRITIDGDTDDIFYDALRRRIYVSCGTAFIDIIEQQSADQYRLIAKIPTASGARTSLFVPEMRRLFLAVPHRRKQRAEVWVYQVK